MLYTIHSKVTVKSLLSDSNMFVFSDPPPFRMPASGDGDRLPQSAPYII